MSAQSAGPALPEGVTIRPFAPGDQAAARALILAGLVEHFGWADERANPDIEEIAASYVAAGHIFLVAECGAALVGTAGLMLEAGGSGRVVRVSVGRAHRRRGIAGALLWALRAAATERGATRLWMETNDDWPDAIGFYEAMGFREYARHDGSVYLALDLSARPAPLA